ALGRQGEGLTSAVPFEGAPVPPHLHERHSRGDRLAFAVQPLHMRALILDDGESALALAYRRPPQLEHAAAGGNDRNLRLDRCLNRIENVAAIGEGVRRRRRGGGGWGGG